MDDQAGELSALLPAEQGVQNAHFEPSLFDKAPFVLKETNKRFPFFGT
jgi:hypothetical protein